MKRKLFLVLVVLILIPAFVVFAGGEKEGGGKKTVGFALWTMEYTFFQNLEAGVKAGCADLGYNYIMLDQNSDPAKMVQDINSLVGQKVDGLVVTPVEAVRWQWSLLPRRPRKRASLVRRSVSAG